MLPWIVAALGWVGGALALALMYRRLAVVERARHRAEVKAADVHSRLATALSDLRDTKGVAEAWQEAASRNARLVEVRTADIARLRAELERYLDPGAIGALLRDRLRDPSQAYHPPPHPAASKK